MVNATHLKQTIRKQIITIVALAIVMALILWASGSPKWVERYYSEGLYPVICRALHPVMNIFPFSVGDVIYIIVVGYFIYALVKVVVQLVKKRFLKAGVLTMGCVIGIQAAFIIFYLFWGLNYFRPGAGERLNLRDTNYTTAHLQAVTHKLIDSANACRARLTAADTIKPNSAIYQTAISAILKLSADSVNFRTYSPRLKPSLLTPLLNYIGTSGYYNPFTSESQLNYQMPYFERPVTACHELSHQTGFGAEDEADFAGYIAGVGSSDRLLRYSAYQLGVTECMRALRYRDTSASNAMKKFISPKVRYDIIQQRLYWMKYRGRLDVFSSVFYDNFLKVNNQPHGLGTYDQMVLLLMAWYR